MQRHKSTPASGSALKIIIAAAICLLRAGSGGAAEFFHLDDWLVVSLSPAEAQGRFLLDFDGETTGFGAEGMDYLLENGRLFKYPAGGTAWVWDEVAPPYHASGRHAELYVFRDLPFQQGLRWYGEKTPSEHLPGKSLLAGRAAVARVAEFLPWPEGNAPSQAELLEPDDCLKPSLAERWPAQVDAYEWQPLDSNLWSTALQWKSQVDTQALPLVFSLQDASGPAEELVPASIMTSGNLVRCSGTWREMAWDVVLDARLKQGEDELVMVCQLQAAEDRTVTLRMGCRAALAGWQWHDSPWASRLIVDQLIRRADMPLGVVSSEAAAWVALVPPDEPRLFEIQADPVSGFWGLSFEATLTPLTVHFPGRAVFVARFKRVQLDPGQNPYRVAAQAYIPLVNYGAPLQALSGVFAAGSPQAVEVDPFFQRLTLTRKHSWGGEDVLRLLRWLSSHSVITPGTRYSSALLGLIQDAQGAAVMEWLDLSPEDPPSVCMEVNPDPEHPPYGYWSINRAYDTWAECARKLPGKRAIWVHGLPDVKALNYSRPAIQAAAFPCASEKGLGAPAVLNAFAACDFLKWLRCHLQKKPTPLLVDCGGIARACAADVADVPVFSAADAAGDALRENLFAARVLAGSKPALLALGSSNASVAALCFGLAPMMTGTSAATPAFPLAERLSRSGWQPQPLLQGNQNGINLEQFGGAADDVFTLTAFNYADLPQSLMCTGLHASQRFMVNPLTAEVRWWMNDQPFELALKAGEGAILDFWRLAWVQTFWPALDGIMNMGIGTNEAQQVHANLDAVLRECEWNVACWLQPDFLMVADDPNSLNLVVRNLGRQPLRIQDVRVVADTSYRPFACAPMDVAAGATVTVTGGVVRAEDLQGRRWLQIQWQLRRGAQTLDGSRWWAPQFQAPLEVQLPQAPLSSKDLELQVPLRFRNFSHRPRLVALWARGDFPEARMEYELPADAAQIVHLPLAARDAGRGQMRVIVETEGQLVAEAWLELEFGAAAGKRAPGE